MSHFDTALWMLLDDAASEEVARDEANRALASAAVALIIVGDIEDRALRAASRHNHRAYLLRSDLAPHPREDSAWLRLYRNQNDRAFILTTGLNVETFNLILRSGFQLGWETYTVPRNDVASAGNPRPGGRSLDAAGALGLVLHYLNSTSRETSLQQIFALTASTCSRYITWSLDILLDTLRIIRAAAILWPAGEEFEQYAALVQSRHPRLFGAFGTIDGLNLPVQVSDDEEIENATYNGWLHGHFVSSVLAFSPRGKIIAARVNCPGSWHDSRVAQPIYEKLRTATPDGYYLVADTAFPRGTDQINGKIRTPMKQGQVLPEDVGERETHLAVDRELISYRQTAEWGMRALQGSFGRLRIPLKIRSDKDRASLLETCIRLHNLRTELVGINQIQQVYEPIWRQDQDDIWYGFTNIFFGEQRKRDRVQAFHHVPLVQ